MSRIFLSHSSKDDVEAVAVCDWLNENGWDDVFLDLTREQGIHPGERWERALHEQAARCEAVLFLVSQNWLASEWCRREHELARRLNKRIFVVLIDQLAIAELPSYLTQTHQAVSLVSGQDHALRRVTLPVTHEEHHVTFSREGLARLKAGLAQAGLDPRFFAWPPESDPKRAPYRGLDPLDAVDAGIFFGREAPIIEALDALRGLREGAAPRLFVLLGASGAGKSSFLRAGLLPRLTRDDRNFLPLIPIRPERATLTGTNGLVAALATVFAANGMPATRSDLRAAADAGPEALRASLRDLGARAATASGAAAAPTLVIPVDQAEELFRAEGGKESDRLLALLRGLIEADDPPVIALFCIRSDSYDALERAKPLQGVRQNAFPLLPMPRGAYQTVIEGPMQRLARAGRKFEIDPALTESLLADIEQGGGDALPLLAFTLQQLFYEHEAAGRLSHADYQAFGGLKGAIDASVARVFADADKNPDIPREPAERLSLLRRGLVPWLAGIDPETKTPRRRRAPAAQIPPEACPLMDLLVEHRLLTRAVAEESNEVTLEPAHEALLRQWGSLRGWLDEDFARLVTLEGIKRAARDWDANACDPAWAAHRGGRLDEAARLDTRPDLAALLDANDRAYLAACREKQNEEQARELAYAAAERRTARRTRIGFAVASVLAVLAIAAATFGWYSANVADEQTKIAEQQKTKVEQRSAVLAARVSRAHSEEGALDQALLLMLDAARVFDDVSVPDEIRIALTAALTKKARIETRTLFPNMQVFEAPDGLLLQDPATKDVWKLTDSMEPKLFLRGLPAEGAILRLQATPDDKEYVILRESLVVERINATNGARRVVASFPEPRKSADRVYHFRQWTLTEDGLVVREFGVVDGIKPAHPYVQILDTDTARLTEGDVAWNTLVQKKGAEGQIYAFENVKKQILEIAASADGLTTSNADLSERDARAARYRGCLGALPDSAQSKAFEVMELGVPNATFRCRKFGRNHLIEDVRDSSAGPLRRDFLVLASGKTIDIRALLSNSITNLSRNNVAAVAGHPPSNVASDLTKTERIAVLLNRTAFVLGRNAPAKELNDEAASWFLLLNYRHTTPAGATRFTGPDRLVVIESESGRIVEHDFGAKPRRGPFATALDDIVGGQGAVRTLHHGTCVGYLIPRDGKAVLPDRREIVFDTRDMSHGGGNSQLRIIGGGIVQLGKDANCVQFSRDWKRMLVVRKGTVAVYDFSRVLSSSQLAGNEIGTISLENVTSGFFVGATGERIVTANSSNKVQLWQQNPKSSDWTRSELYQGDNEIRYAEPDAEGRLLILFEDVGNGNVHGFLYSIDSRQVWYDLGVDYKWLGAAFTEGAEVVVSEHGKWVRVLPLLPLSALAALGDQQLSPECRPPSPKEYRRSSCWPSEGGIRY